MKGTLWLTVAVLAVLGGCEHGTRAVRGAQLPLHRLLRVTAITPLPMGLGDHPRTRVHHDSLYYYVLAPDGLTATSFVFTRVRKADGHPDTVALRKPVADTLPAGGVVMDVAIGRDRVMILYWRTLFVFDTGAGLADASEPRVIRLPLSYANCAFVGRDAYLWRSDINLQGATRTVVAKVNLDDARVTWTKDLDDPLGIEFTYFQPRRLMVLNRTGIYVADATRYSIARYSLDGQPMGALQRTGLQGWSEDTSYLAFSPIVHPELTNMPKRSIDSLRRYVASSPMIRTISLYGDDALLVTVQHPQTFDSGFLKGQPVVTHDVWRLSDSGWTLAAQDLIDFNPDPAQRYADVEMMALSFEYGISGGDLLWRRRPYPAMDYSDLTFQRIQDSADRFALSRGLQYSLVTYDWR